MGNGPEMDFSAPPDAQGHAGVFTPEDAFVAAVNTCVMMMFLWTAERFCGETKTYNVERYFSRKVFTSPYFGMGPETEPYAVESIAVGISIPRHELYDPNQWCQNRFSHFS